MPNSAYTATRRSPRAAMHIAAHRQSYAVRRQHRRLLSTWWAIAGIHLALAALIFLAFRFA